MSVVPRVRTPIDAESASKLLSATYQVVLGRAASPNVLGSLMALVWIETGRGGSVNNHNYGNISASPSFGGNVWRPPWFDFDGGTADTPRNRELHEAMLRNQAPSAFRAYANADAGMLDFVQQIQNRFPEVHLAAETGNPDAFRRALAIKYSPDYLNPRHSESFATLFREFGLSPKAEAGAASLLSSQGLVSLPSLRFGLSGPAVRLLGALLGVPSGSYDGALVLAVKTFQKSTGLKPDGICGPQTWGALAARASMVVF